jgi:hypothetical protein
MQRGVSLGYLYLFDSRKGNGGLFGRPRTSWRFFNKNALQIPSTCSAGRRNRLPFPFDEFLEAPFIIS